MEGKTGVYVKGMGMHLKREYVFLEIDSSCVHPPTHTLGELILSDVQRLRLALGATEHPSPVPSTPKTPTRADDSRELW